MKFGRYKATALLQWQRKFTVIQSFEPDLPPGTLSHFSAVQFLLLKTLSQCSLLDITQQVFCGKIYIILFWFSHHNLASHKQYCHTSLQFNSYF